MIRTVANALGVRADEQQRVGLLLVHSFFMGIFVSSYFSFANGAFLGVFDLSMLPWAYLASGASGFVATSLFARFQSRFRLTRVLLLTLAFLLVLTVLFRFGLLTLGQQPWLVFLIFIWAGPFLGLIGLQFWNMVSNLFDLRQGKRLFGLIGSGDVLSSILGYLSIPLLLTVMEDAANLMVLGLFGLLTGIFFQVVLIRKFGTQINQETSGEQAAPAEKAKTSTYGFSSLFRHRYFGWVFLLMLVSVFCSYLVDFSFMGAIRLKYAGNPKAITGFIGGFFGAIKLAELLGKTLLTGSVLSRFGIRFGLLLLPLLLLFFALWAVLAGGFSDTTSAGLQVGTLLLLPLAFNKLFDRFIRRSIEEPSIKVLYQPLEDQARQWLQTQTEGSARQLAVVLAGAFLIIGSQYSGFGILQVALTLALLLGGWMWIGHRMAQAYRQNLLSKINQSREEEKAVEAEGSATNMDTAQYLETLCLKAPPEEAIVAFAMLEKLVPGRMSHVVNQWWAGEEWALQLKALAVMERELYLDQLPALQSCATNGWTSTAQQQLKQAIDTLQTAEQWNAAGLQNRADSANSNDRRNAARLLRYCPKTLRTTLAAELLKDAHVDVVRATIHSIPADELTNYAEVLVQHLASTELRRTVFYQLAQGDAALFAALRQAAKWYENAPEVLVRLLSVLAKIGGEAALESLMELQNHPDSTVRSVALRETRRLNLRVGTHESALLKDKIRKDLRFATWLLAARLDLEEETAAEALVEDMEVLYGKALGNVFELLSFFYDASAIQHIKTNLESDDNARQVLALEMMDLLLAEDLKELVAPLLEPGAPGDRLKKLRRDFPQQRLKTDHRLADLLLYDYSQLPTGPRLGALELLAERNSEDLGPVIALTYHHDPILKETAYRVLYRRDESLYFHYIAHETEKFRQHLHNLLQVQNHRQKELSWTALLQILKQVPAFENLPKALLMHLIRHCQQAWWMPSKTIGIPSQKQQPIGFPLQGPIRSSDQNGGLHETCTFELLGLDQERTWQNETLETEFPIAVIWIDAGNFYDLLDRFPELTHTIFQWLRRTESSETLIIST